MVDLFSEYKPGDEANCFYCDAWLNWNDMQPTVWGPELRENVCADCRAEEVANNGWMIRTPVAIKARQERRHAVLSNVTEDLPVLRAADESVGIPLRALGVSVDEARRISDLIHQAERGKHRSKIHRALQLLRLVFRLP